MRTKFAEICKNIVQTDDKSVIVIGDISHYLLRDAQDLAPDRFFNIGICEQSTVNVAAGMSLEGMRPIIHTIAPFVVERAYEQIKVGLGYQNTDVTIITVGGTYDYADLGCTHHCYSDIALMRSIPGMDVYEPGSASEFEQLFNQSWANGNPKYFRLSNHSHTQDLVVKSNPCTSKFGLRKISTVNNKSPGGKFSNIRSPKPGNRIVLLGVIPFGITMSTFLL